jgi:hypothetical protein
MTGGGRADRVEHATRVNAAAQLLDAGLPVAEAARVLADRFAVSTRQARRYVDQAATGGRMPVPETSVVFTVKLPAALAERVRAHARQRGTTISAVVTRALTEFFTPAAEGSGAGERPGGRDRVRLRPPRGHGFVSGLRHPRTATTGPPGGRPGRKSRP